MVQQRIKLVSFSGNIIARNLSDLHALSRSRLFQETKCGISNADAERQVGRLGEDTPFLSALGPTPPGKARKPRVVQQQSIWCQPTDNTHVTACYLCSRALQG